MSREEFLKRFSNQKTLTKYDTIFRKFDEFLSKRLINEDDFLALIAEREKFARYNLLQELTFFLSESLSPRSTRNYFDSIFKYLLYVGCDLDHTQRKIRIQFPRVTKKIPEGLDLSRIRLLLDHSDFKMGLLMRCLGGGGFRESEALQLKPKYFEFVETALPIPTKVSVVPEIAKFNIGRETYLPPKTASDLKSYIRSAGIKPDEFIFVDEFTENTVTIFDRKFGRIRIKAGLDTKERKRNQHNDLKLHSFRAWFITTWDQLGKQSFGHALAGHSKDLSVYFRMSPEARIEQYKQYQDTFDF